MRTYKTKWNKRFTDLAKFVSSWSLDPSSKVASVITENKRIVSVGFNGFPTGVSDYESRYYDREEKYPRVVHSEINSILFAGRSIRGCNMFCTHIPCSQCAAAIIQSGIEYVVCPVQDRSFVERWSDPIRITLSMFAESRIPVYIFNEDAVPAGTFQKETSLYIVDLSNLEIVCQQPPIA